MAKDAQNGGAENRAFKAVNFTALKPQLFVEATKANDAVQFYKAAFGSKAVSCNMHSKKKADMVLSAKLKLESFAFLVSDLTEDSSALVKARFTGGVFGLETEDVVAAVTNAVATNGVAEQIGSEGDGECCGGRVRKVKDPFGKLWLICSPSKKAVDMEA